MQDIMKKCGGCNCHAEKVEENILHNRYVMDEIALNGAELGAVIEFIEENFIFSVTEETSVDNVILIMNALQKFRASFARMIELCECDE